MVVASVSRRHLLIHFFNLLNGYYFSYLFQAYTNELENKVSRLEEENERLKKQKVDFSLFIILHMLYLLKA